MKKACAICMAGVLTGFMQLAVAQLERTAESSSQSSPSDPPSPSSPIPGVVWTTNVGAAASATSGNASTKNTNLVLDSQRRTEVNKLSLNAEFVRSSAEVVDSDTGKKSEAVTAFRELFGTRYDRNVSERVFAFGGLELSRDRIALIDLRQVYSIGFGYQFLRGQTNSWETLGGLSYRHDQYADDGVEVHGNLRERLSVHELVFGQESRHHIAKSVEFQQKLTINRSVGEVQGARAQLDVGVQLALNELMSLSLKWQRRYDGMAREPVQQFDTLVFIGINMKFGG